MSRDGLNQQSSAHHISEEDAAISIPRPLRSSASQRSSASLQVAAVLVGLSASHVTPVQSSLADASSPSDRWRHDPDGVPSLGGYHERTAPSATVDGDEGFREASMDLSVQKLRHIFPGHWIESQCSRLGISVDNYDLADKLRTYCHLLAEYDQTVERANMVRREDGSPKRNGEIHLVNVILFSALGRIAQTREGIALLGLTDGEVRLVQEKSIPNSEIPHPIREKLRYFIDDLMGNSPQPPISLTSSPAPDDLDSDHFPEDEGDNDGVPTLIDFDPHADTDLVLTPEMIKAAGERDSDAPYIPARRGSAVLTGHAAARSPESSWSKDTASHAVVEATVPSLGSEDECDNFDPGESVVRSRESSIVDRLGILARIPGVATLVRTFLKPPASRTRS